MKTQLIKLMFATGILIFAFCNYSNAQNNSANSVQSVPPSAIIKIQKADANSIEPMRKAKHKNEENEFTEEFKKVNVKSKVAKSAIDYTGENNYAARVNPCPLPPQVQANFEGNPQTQFYHLPVGYYTSECGIAISNAGKIVSISNYWMRYYNENGTLVFSDSLFHFANSLIDCHVLYDPKADRFIFSSQYGYYDPFVFNVYGTAIGFSKSNDPMDGWNLYQLPFTNFHDNSIGDYPLLAISDSEVFITIDYYNSGDRFKHLEILQINKGDGYAGSASVTSQKYDAPLNGNTKGTMVPAQGGSTTYGPNMYFIMANESGNTSNKYYVYEITNTIVSGQAVLNRYGPVTSNIYYSPSETSYQPGGIPVLDLFAADDDFIENAFYENGIIQFCQNTKSSGKAAALIGRISGIPNNLNCTAKTINNPNLYLCYPSIAYAGNSSADNSAILGVEHSGVNTFPGLSAVYINSNFDASALTTIKTGNDTINGLWGDYSGICRRYNHPGEVWFEGQCGFLDPNKINWIAKLQSPPACSQRFTSGEILNNALTIFPNPLSNITTIFFALSKSQNGSLKIFDVNGKLVSTLADRIFEAGENEITWNASDVNAGVYFLQFQSAENLRTEKLIVTK